MYVCMYVLQVRVRACVCMCWIWIWRDFLQGMYESSARRDADSVIEVPPPLRTTLCLHSRWPRCAPTAAAQSANSVALRCATVCGGACAAVRVRHSLALTAGRDSARQGVLCGRRACVAHGDADHCRRPRLAAQDPIDLRVAAVTAHNVT